MFEITQEQQTVLDWMDEVCGTALKESRNRNLSLVTRIGKQEGALAYYLFNVVSLGTITREQFVQQYPGFMTEATMLYNEYQQSLQVTEAVAKNSQLEEQLAELKQMVEAQAEVIKALSEQKSEAKPAGKKKSAKVEPTEEEDGDAESEA